MTDFRLEETPIPTPGSGQLLLEVQYLSLDPYMRGRMDDLKSYAKPLQLGDVMTGETVARVVASNRPGYSEGDIVLAPAGWRTRSPMASAFASLIPLLHRSRPASACLECQDSRLIPAYD